MPLFYDYVNIAFHSYHSQTDFYYKSFIYKVRQDMGMALYIIVHQPCVLNFIVDGYLPDVLLRPVVLSNGVNCRYIHLAHNEGVGGL